MAKLIRQFPVAGMEHILTSAGEIVFINGEAEVDDEVAAKLSAISDIRVVKSRVPAGPSEEEKAKAAQEEQDRADAEVNRLKNEEDQKAAEEAQKAAEEAQKAAEEAQKAAQKQAEEAAKALATPKVLPKAPVGPASKKPPALR